MTLDFIGKTVAVTGVCSGFGRAIAARFIDGGARVFGCDIAADRIEVLRAQINLTATTVDLADRDAAADWIASIEAETGGPLNILINNAGGPLGLPYAPIEDSSFENWDRIFAANVGAAYVTCRAAARGMKAAGRGRIVNITSGAGLRPSLSGLQAYASAKHAMVGLTRQLAVEFGPHGITVNSVAPGLQMTDEKKIERWETYSPEKQSTVLSRIALGRLGGPDDIAKGVVFFASDLADFVTGEILSVNGGSF